MGIRHSNLGSFSLCTYHLRIETANTIAFYENNSNGNNKDIKYYDNNWNGNKNTTNMMTTTKKTSMQFPETFYNKHIACTFKIFRQAYFTQLPLNESYWRPLNRKTNSKIYNMHEFCKTQRTCYTHPT